MDGTLRRDGAFIHLARRMRVAVAKNMKVALGKFARFSIEARFGADLAEGVQVALRHYARRLKSATKPAAVPAFRRNERLDASGAEFELDVEPDIQATLEREAERQSVRVEELLAHAVLVYLADLDSPAGLPLGSPDPAFGA